MHKSSTTPTEDLRVLIVAEHTSRRFGGEAVLPIHYFDHLHARGIPVWLITHSRVRSELENDGYNPEYIRYLEDLPIQRFLWNLGKALPHRIDHITFGYISRLINQIRQRKEALILTKEKGINVIHQPIPVSPKEPSLLYNLGVPIIIGPMNGGMDFPPAFRTSDSPASRLIIKSMRLLSHVINIFIPGKKRAALLLVANERTKLALPRGHAPRIEYMVENGVDLKLWRQKRSGWKSQETRFAYTGRLVDWKRVDLLIEAFSIASKTRPMTLTIIGGGELQKDLESKARDLGILSPNPNIASKIHFAGWLDQPSIAEFLGTQDCLVLPSVRECGGAVVLEAMATGLPVIATNWGGPADYLDESCGILVSPSSETGLTQGIAVAMTRLSQNPELMQELGNNGRKRAEAIFDWEKKIDQMICVYQGVINSKDSN